MAQSEARQDGTDDAPLGLLIVWWLAALAGAVDACGLSLLKGLFVSFMSGNTISLGLALARGEWSRAGLVAAIILVFVAGAAVGEMVALRLGRRHLPAVTLLVAIVLAGGVLVRPATILALAFAMGAFNAAMQRAGRISVSITYVTGTLVRFGQGLGQWLSGRARDRSWIEQATPWTGLLTGAVVATVGLAELGRVTFACLPAAAAVISVVTWFADRPHG